ncbi:hypothetical protein [Rhodococcus sp. T7]|uniref:hypothetical protein n=1 Tax=Rhodococcus sp. T7 TaxID=627444 RepID=UPI00135B5991|nr:hypothetical protein [Rhodococcus sp. T7]KAF0958469.1 hypothetical protein MLGJGCBP_08448 [Rhodococcus sp. T7]
MQQYDNSNDDAIGVTRSGRIVPRPPDEVVERVIPLLLAAAKRADARRRASGPTKLTDWVPDLANELGKPETVVHLWAQRAAGELGVNWGMEMNAGDVDAITKAVRKRYGS